MPNETPKRRKFNEKQVNEVRDMAAMGYSNRAIANQLNMDRTTVARILKGNY